MPQMKNVFFRCILESWGVINWGAVMTFFGMKFESDLSNENLHSTKIEQETWFKWKSRKYKRQLFHPSDGFEISQISGLRSTKFVQQMKKRLVNPEYRNKKIPTRVKGKEYTNTVGISLDTVTKLIKQSPD